MFFGDIVVLGELPCPHGAGTNVPDLAAADKIVERAHGFFGRSVRVVAVDLEEVNVRRLQALFNTGSLELPLGAWYMHTDLERLFNGVEDCGTR